MTRIEEIEARLKRATPGPWRWMNCLTLVADHGKRPVVLTTNGELEVRGPDGTLHLLSIDGADPTLIAHAPADLRFLLDENAKLRKALEQIATVPDGFTNTRSMASAALKESV